MVDKAPNITDLDRDLGGQLTLDSQAEGIDDTRAVTGAKASPEAAAPPTPGRNGCGSVGAALGKGAVMPSVPMRKAVVGVEPMHRFEPTALAAVTGP